MAENAKRRAKGLCELCGGEAPFSRADGDPYLATPHVVWLAQSGSDTVETVALCSNCHRKMTGSFVHIQVKDAAAGLLTVLAEVPRGWGRARLDLAGACARTQMAD